MGTNESPRNRGVNAAVRFDLAAFTERFFATIGADGTFTGPGPVSLTRMDCRPAAERFTISHLAEEMFSKFNDGVKTDAKRDVAIRKFEEAETICALTNCKFQFSGTGQEPSWLDPFYGGWTEELEVDRAVFRRAKSIISRILGTFPGWEAVLLHADFGPGGTTRLSRAESHRSNKWGGVPHVGLDTSSLLEDLYKVFPLLKERSGHQDRPYECVDGNKLDWVPKNYKTDRTIAIEADFSMFFQKGIGALIRKRLKRVKQDLDDQGTNQFLAAVGSIDGSLATLDLSMASDTVAYNLARYLLRPDWFEALDKLRSSVGFYSHQKQDIAVGYEKLSSMGNGYTFEVESLIFYGLLRAVSELSEQSDHRLYVYGDDIVVPSGMASVAMAYLNKAGFRVNQTKSFWDGPFRESCGGHYFSGSDVTPFYVREEVDLVDRLFLLHNNVYRWFNRHPYITEPEKVRDLLTWIRGHAPELWRQPRLMTEDVGDGAFIGSFDEVRPESAGKRFVRAGWEGWKVDTLQFRNKRERKTVKLKHDKKRRPWGAFKPFCTEEREPDFTQDQAPDLVSLWSLMGSDLRVKQQRQGLRPHTGNGEDLTWAKSRDFVDSLFPTGKVGADIPHAERWWYVAAQILPFRSGVSWW